MTLPTLCPAGLPPKFLVDVTPVGRGPLHLGAAAPGVPARLRAVILIVAGVAGSGKTTVGALLAGQLRWPFADADTFHPEANVAKMRAGIPLTDADRQPWLRAVAEWMDARIASGESAVVTCSALKRAYRDLLLDGRPTATMVFLQVSRDVLDRRLMARHGHFFPEKLLDSQLAALEPPTPDERVRTVLAEGDSAQTAATIIALLWPDGDPGQGA
jgi:gluconokinase